jgi:hypothetical protein
MIMNRNRNIASFVLRFTQELRPDADGEPQVAWRGHIRHVQGDEEKRFIDLAEALIFIQIYLTQLTMDTLTGYGKMSQEKILGESFNLWHKFASSYSDMMLQPMEQTLRQSETFREQVDETRLHPLWNIWQIPKAQPNNQEELLAMIKELQLQVQTLSYKVDKLEKELQQEKGLDQEAKG